ncbi:hypothetical protein EGW08_008086 [Elysia chlorotica]|uniref:G-protein coupled receptors family 1 profile domain-containing protein n=1 Tax=Elysia chlorotica TaxID=188477 RepID=A0A433TRN1_ELYCH|nr:hypothetical protein EGW08_008086 [Elysia chlorotica]
MNLSLLELMEQNATNSSGPETEQSLPEPTSLDPFGYLLDAVAILSWATLSAGTVGIVGNVLSLIVYVKLGFANTINISYVALAVSDLGSCITSMTATFFISPAMKALAQHYRLQLDQAHLGNFIGYWPHVAFSRTTAFFTAWISFERCMCVLFPSRVKLFITRRVTKMVVSAIFVLGCSPLVLAYINLESGWSFDPETNITTVTLFFAFEERPDPFFAALITIYCGIYPVLSWTTVTVCTTFLIIKLRESAKWREANASVSFNASMKSGVNNRNENRTENRITKTVVMIACMFIICSFPDSFTNIGVTVWRKKYSLYGPLRSLVVFVAVIAVLLSLINSSSNIIFYTITGARFRSTLKKMFVK